MAREQRLPAAIAGKGQQLLDELRDKEDRMPLPASIDRMGNARTGFVERGQERADRLGLHERLIGERYQHDARLFGQTLEPATERARESVIAAGRIYHHLDALVISKWLIGFKKLAASLATRSDNDENTVELRGQQIAEASR